MTGTQSVQPQALAGTAAYMAPELFQGTAHRASDQYALAVVVYEWLAGTLPFPGPGSIQYGYQHVHQTPPPPQAHVPTLSAGVEQVVLTALAKAPQERFASVRAFATAFEQACQASGIPRARPGAETGPAVPPPTAPAPTPATTPPPDKAPAPPVSPSPPTLGTPAGASSDQILKELEELKAAMRQLVQQNPQQAAALAAQGITPPASGALAGAKSGRAGFKGVQVWTKGYD